MSFMDPTPARYAIRIHGHPGATVLSAFPALASRRHGADTVLTAMLDRRSALWGVLAEIEALGLDLVAVRQLTPDRKSAESGDSWTP
jgi:endonuclease/exonuclease/phosphatase family metal-dependent hydrolase